MSLGSFLDPTFPASPVDVTTFGVGDEYLCDLAASEFALVCPRDQDGASGLDGAFAATDRFTLLSSTVGFAAQGVAVGDVVAIYNSKDFARVRGLWVASAVGANSVTLRARGPRVGYGSPPGALGGESGLGFRVPTARPQVALAAAKFARRYRIASASNVLGPYDFAPAVALDALADLYTLASRMATVDASRDSLYAKAKGFRADLAEEVRILDSTYGTEPDRPRIIGKSLRIGTAAPCWPSPTSPPANCPPEL